MEKNLFLLLGLILSNLFQPGARANPRSRLICVSKRRATFTEATYRQPRAQHLYCSLLFDDVFSLYPVAFGNGLYFCALYLNRAVRASAEPSLGHSLSLKME